MGGPRRPEHGTAIRQTAQIGQPDPCNNAKDRHLLDLVRNRRISLSGSEQTYGASNRTLLRDLQELRNIGETAGFRISERDMATPSSFPSSKAGPRA